MIDSDVAGDSGLQSNVLEDLREAVNYQRWLAGLAVPYLGADPIEIGSGLGDYAEIWARRVGQVTATEADPARLAALEARFRPSDRPPSHGTVSVRKLAAPIDEDGEHTAVVAYNVLEHIPDDIGALRTFGRLVGPGGAVVLLVPAFSFAMSRFDAQIGHQRRYTRRSLAAALAAAGLRVERAHYVNSAGLLAWLVMMKLLRQHPRAGMALRAYDRLVVPCVRRLEAHVTPPFGQSVFTVARPG
jgi:SAM-dependent methyltransferase